MTLAGLIVCYTLLDRARPEAAAQDLRLWSFEPLHGVDHGCLHLCHVDHAGLNRLERTVPAARLGCDHARRRHDFGCHRRDTTA